MAHNEGIMDLFVGKDKFITASLDYTLHIWEFGNDGYWRPVHTFGNLSGNVNQFFGVQADEDLKTIIGVIFTGSPLVW